MFSFILYCYLYTDVLQADDLSLLVRDLGSTTFKVRESARKKIKERMNFDVYLRIKDIESEELEVKVRLKRLTTEYLDSMKEKYSIEITDYPEFPWIDQLPTGYKCDGMTKHEIFNKYWWRSLKLDGKDIWYCYRCQRATKLWLHERLSGAFKDAWEGSKNDEEFTTKMDLVVRSIRDDIQVLIQGEDNYYLSQGRENPSRKRKDYTRPKVEINY